MNRIHSFEESLNMLRRHVLLLVSVCAVGIIVSVVYALSLQRLYETSAVIQIEQPRIREPQTTSATANSATMQQLQIIEQQVMARDNLLHIAQEYDLFADRPELSEAERVVQMRQAASVRQISDPNLRWRSDLTPTAMQITARWGDPELAAAIANELVTNVLEQNRRRRAERARETLEFFESEEERVGQAIARLEGEIARFKRENAQYLPDGLSGLREERSGLRESMFELDRQILELQAGQPTPGSIMAARVTRLEEQRDLIGRRIDEIETIIQASPEVEREFNQLTRRLEKLSEQYQVITRNQAEAEMGQMLQTSQQSESFTVLERALVPEHPISPNRKRIVFIGAALSALVALVLMILLELRNPVLRSATQFERQVGIRPIVSIPIVELPGERRKRWFIWGGEAALILFVAVLILLFILG
ncbi:Uncharacterized protein involved in exopolysaccharide biosynthesis [Salinihabitans flavidus]|uniref:Uncharacterized protein involved in exopolysaccharide biosynthesis n=1 Tax=Salinihabitans flavidus TaxID=569882 RepID=A0A1H8QSL8_9RHOB|nr:Wzz/FepE/Etk N-terminal domain-containing protein [Salinihabitans flavidus]SEO57220.1 Uncharacterized protein involved in exopolysaccharide biosynthesis [Salinihabitans flavidus]